MPQFIMRFWITAFFCIPTLSAGVVFSPFQITAQETDELQPQVSAETFQKEVDEFEARLNAADASPAEDKTKLDAELQVIRSFLAKASESAQRAEEDQAKADAATENVERLKLELSKLRDSPAAEISPEITLADLKSQAQSVSQKIERQTESASALDVLISGRSSTRQTLIESLDAANESANELEQALAALPVADSSLAAAAKRLKLNVSLRSVLLEREALLAKQKLIEAEDATDLPRIQKDLLTLKIERNRKLQSQLEKLIAAKKLADANDLAKTAQQKQVDIKNTAPALESGYEQNTQLAIRVQEIEKSIQEATAREDKLKTRLDDLTEKQTSTQRRVEVIGLTNAVGAMLRQQRADLSLQRQNELEQQPIAVTLNDVEFERLEKDDARSRTDVASIIAELQSARVAAEKNPLTDKELIELESSIAELVDSRREKLLAVVNGLKRWSDVLLQVKMDEEKLSQRTLEFKEYINERILWIRSNDLLFSSLEIDDSDKELSSWPRWIDVAKKLWAVFFKNPIVFVAAAIAISLMLMFKPKLRREIDRMGIEAVKGSCETLWPTVHAIGLTILVAITVSLIPLVLGLAISYYGPTDNPIFDAIGKGLLAAAKYAIPMEILRRMCRSEGLAKCHFHWPNAAIDKLRKQLDWHILPSSALVFSIVLFHSLDTTHRGDLIERILFVSAMLLMGYFVYLTLNPKTGIFSGYLSRHEKSWLNQTSTLWFGLIMFVPVALAALTVWGYYYSALNLASCLYATFVFALIAETIHAFIRRLILLGRRRVHIQAARKKRELQIRQQKEAIKAKKEADRLLSRSKSIAAAGSDQDESGLTEVAPSQTTVEIPSVDSMVDLQPSAEIDDSAVRARKLVGLVMVVAYAFGLWMIWSDVMPALQKLDSITLWPGETTLLVDSASSTASTGSQLTPYGPIDQESSSSEVAPAGSNAAEAAASNDVSVRDLLKFLAIALLTILSARNLPSAIEMLFLDHLPVDRSFRYASKALISYAIIMLGMVLAFNALSIGWNNVQWLATALTFGLAFGLQEIFANFVAGIILMFERPIRIGDWVTVDEYTGAVSKIRTRATTIVNWDRKEYVIPNKDFITGRLINWTLSDAVNRLVLTVGVAYGADVVKAKKILLEICKSHPKIITEPPTTVVFDLFGDSSLNLTVRTFLGEVESRLAVIDDLHTQINQAFAEAGIEISFPQRDLHIRSNDGSLMTALHDVANSESDPDEA